MANKRMFSMEVVDTDRFLDLPASTQLLYFHLGMRADDDGFVSSPRKIARTVNCSIDDLNILVLKGFIIPFESGVCVIVDWKLNNDFKRDRFHPTVYQTEFQKLGIENRRYFLLGSDRIQNGNMMETRWRQDGDRTETESSLIQSSLIQSNPIQSSLVQSSRSSPAREGDQVTAGRQPSDDEPPAEDERRPQQPFPAPLLDSVKEYAQEQGASDAEAVKFFDYNSARGWLISGKPCADWKALFRGWMSHVKPTTTSGKTEQELIEESRKYSL